MTRIVLATLAALPALTGCAGVTSTASPGHSDLTADQIMTHLTQQVTTATLTLAYTAENDPNDLLGRPNGYTSKVAFTDSRIPAEDVEFSDPDAIERGGSVEVFADQAGAQKRKQYIQTIAAELPFATEYDYVSGPILVRVSQELTPDQAGERDSCPALTVASTPAQRLPASASSARLVSSPTPA